MKGIVLAGGYGTRLFPNTLGVSKQLLPVYNKPMIYYPISILFSCGINEILIITNKHHLDNFRRLLGDGSKFGVSFQYMIQNNPNGIAESLILAESFIQDNNICLILGDNIFHGNGQIKLFNNAIKELKNNRISSIFGYQVANPNRYGVVNFKKNNEIIDIEEKPVQPKSNYAVVGIYFYTSEVIKIAKKLKPSKRGELEITDLNKNLLTKKKLRLDLIESSSIWLDTGTADFLLDASNLIKTIEKRNGKIIACLEEISHKMGFIKKEKLQKIISNLSKSEYDNYLRQYILNEVKQD